MSTHRQRKSFNAVPVHANGQSSMVLLAIKVGVNGEVKKYFLTRTEARILRDQLDWAFKKSATNAPVQDRHEVLPALPVPDEQQED